MAKKGLGAKWKKQFKSKEWQRFTNRTVNENNKLETDCDLKTMKNRASVVSNFVPQVCPSVPQVGLVGLP